MAPAILDSLPARVGPLGRVGPYRLSQTEIDIYAALVGDLDPMHNDPKWIVGKQEFGGPIAIGTQSLSRLPWVLGQLGFPVRGDPDIAFRLAALGRVRFIAAVPTGAPVVVDSELTSIDRGDASCRCVTTHVFRHGNDGRDFLCAELVSEFRRTP